MMKPLYVSRPLLETKEFIDWFNTQSIKNILDPSKLHVTVAFSSKPVDWSKFKSKNTKLIITSTADREIANFGKESALVLKFKSGVLQKQHKRFIDGGASWDYPLYMPHVSITYDSEGTNEHDVVPYLGELVFGPEKFEDLVIDG